MIEIVFQYHKKKDNNPKIELLFDKYRQIYNDPVIHKTTVGNVSAISISNNKTTEYQKPVYSNKSKTYIWVIGTIFLSEKELIEQYDRLGIEGLSNIIGWFNILTYSEVSDKLELINSKLGMNIINYYHSHDEAIIANRLEVFYTLKESVSVDRAVVLQQSLYNYPFSNKTHIKEVYELPSAYILFLRDSKITTYQYWHIQDDLVEKPLSFKKSVDLLDDTLDSVIKRLVQKSDKVAISLTGGWDGRLLLAYALKHSNKDKISLYSFGVEDAPDVTIPLNISTKLNFNYYPIYLDNRYVEKHYLDYASKTVLYSNSSRSIRRAHYLYAMEKLSNYADVVLTGNGGSNLLKSTGYTPCLVFNKFVLNLLNAADLRSELQNQLSYVHKTFGSLFEDISLDEYYNSFDTDDLNSILKIENPHERFCTYLITNIERNYFGAEVTTYKQEISNFSPYLDYEFIRTLLKTSFFGGYNENKNMLSTINNTLLYAKLIKRNSPELAAEPTDRGFSMNQIVNPLKYGNLLASYISAKSKIKLKTSSNFNTDNAVKLFNDHYKMNMDDIVKMQSLNKEFIANYISFSWYHKNMIK